MAIRPVFLAHFGFHVIVAEDVAMGVLLARDSRPSVVITELFSRTRTGWNVLEALRARPDTAAVEAVHAVVRETDVPQRGPDRRRGFRDGAAGGAGGRNGGVRRPT